MRYFARGYRVVTYNHRGYAPSSAPAEAGAYSQDILVGDLVRLLRHLGLGRVHLGGCSGHTPNIEEPGLFNLHVAEFLAAVERGRWAGWTKPTTSTKETECDIGSR